MENIAIHERSFIKFNGCTNSKKHSTNNNIWIEQHRLSPFVPLEINLLAVPEHRYVALWYKKTCHCTSYCDSKCLNVVNKYI